MAKQDQREVEYITDRLVEKVWQGDEARRGLARSAASVALAAMQDFTAELYMESAPQFTGADMMRIINARGDE